MKIRTITTGISLKHPQEIDKIQQAANFNQNAKDFLERHGYDVQTTRIATNPWTDYLQDLSHQETIGEIQKIENLCRNFSVNSFNIGYASTPETIEFIAEINTTTSFIYCSSTLGDRATGINFENVKASATLIKRIAEETENGFGNFRFCAWANCPPGIPFFPAAYHQGNSSFSLGLEWSDLLKEAFEKSQNLAEAELNLKSLLEKEFKEIARLALEIALDFNMDYKGIDASLAPSLDKTNSIAYTYESLGFGQFGQPGTLTISALITRVLKNLSVKTCGYSGLMLPVCEDVGLAERASDRTYNLTHLLLYSAVCGCGFDTVPIPGDVTVEKIAAILLDMATLAIKLDKPLSARLFPIPGKKAGEMTTFNSPYLVNCKILEV